MNAPAQPRRLRTNLLLVPVMLVALFVSTVAGVWAATIKVEMGDNVFKDQTVTVNVGDTVTWAHTSQNPHDVTADNGAFSSPRRMTNGQTFSYTATTPGTYSYVCTIHAARGMVGTLIVRAPGAPNTGGGGMAGGAQAPWQALAVLAMSLSLTAGLTIELLRRRRTA